MTLGRKAAKPRATPWPRVPRIGVLAMGRGRAREGGAAAVGLQEEEEEEVEVEEEENDNEEVEEGAAAAKLTVVRGLRPDQLVGRVNARKEAYGHISNLPAVPRPALYGSTPSCCGLCMGCWRRAAACSTAWPRGTASRTQ